MDAYSHITPIERGCIMTLFNQGHCPAAIATMLKRHRCTILRELKRNSAGESYDASKAQEKYDSRRK
uniref:helix-turn-helix domain-containing protein n=2 Tax=Cardiobacterium TaxID=2717 RepID=UPI003965819A